MITAFPAKHMPIGTFRWDALVPRLAVSPVRNARCGTGLTIVSRALAELPILGFAYPILSVELDAVRWMSCSCEARLAASGQGITTTSDKKNGDAVGKVQYICAPADVLCITKAKRPSVRIMEKSNGKA